MTVTNLHKYNVDAFQYVYVFNNRPPRVPPPVIVKCIAVIFHGKTKYVNDPNQR